MRKTTERNNSESGQVLILAVFAMIVTFGMAALSIDIGMFMHERQNVQNAVDAAALAGAQELPENGANAESVARQWAANNEQHIPFNSLNVSFRCLVGDRDNNNLPDTSDIPAVCDPGASLTSFVCRNGSCASKCDFSLPTNRCNTVVVSAAKDVPFHFAPVLSIVDSSSQCAFGDCTTGDISGVACRGACGSSPSVPVDVALAFDETGTMKAGCDGSEASTSPETGAAYEDCPIAQARLAARTLVDQLLPAGEPSQMQVGIAPFRGCYGSLRFNPIADEAPGRGCILFSEVRALTGAAGKAAISNAIDGMHAEGGFPGTNLCTGLDMAGDVLKGAASRATAKKVIIVLTDGDNRYSDAAGGGNPNRGNPIPAVLPVAPWPVGQDLPHRCKPTAVPGDGTAYGADYDAAINQMDALTDDMADSLKGQGVEIFVVRFADPPGDSSASTLCGGVGGGSARDGQNEDGDRNLSRCIASSTAGTNDHYFYAPTPDKLPQIFSQISAQIIKGSRLVDLPQ